jgi:hypothetical protein
MMFFVTIRPESTTEAAYNIEDIRVKIDLLTQMKQIGVLELAYVKIGGGSVYVVNANSFADVRNAFRESIVSTDHSCEILEIDQNAPLHLLGKSR